MTNDVFLSIVSPVYRGEEFIERLIEELVREVSPITENFEIILVDDGYPDKSWSIIKRRAAVNSKVIGVKLSRNFGQHIAINAGLEKARGDWVVVMDCDLQDRPDQIPKLMEKALTGFDYVFAQRVSRKDTFFKKASSRLFYSVLGYLTDTKQDASIANFGVFSRMVIDAVLEIGDQKRYFPNFVRWVGFNGTAVPVEHGKREHNKSSYSFSALFSLALDTIINFSNKPLKLAVMGGLCLSALAFLLVVYTLISYFSGRIEVLGYTSLIVFMLLSTGLIITIVGVAGLYIGAIFEKVKGRPQYYIQETVNDKP